MKIPDVLTPRIRNHPPLYFCPRAKESLKLDGRLDKLFWEHVPFTRPFVDISGMDFPVPRFRTCVKMCWDDEYLYIGALMEGDEIWASLTERDSVIYYDNDFEVFMDPSSSGHNYSELEINALNTQWDLMLTHPYRTGGRSVSGWNMKGLHTAVYIQGDLNKPDADNLFWSAEIAIPFASIMETYSLEENPPDLERCYPCRKAPRSGEFWRMNFSRVHWPVDVYDRKFIKKVDERGKPQPEDNWVWAPTGLIDIHCPEFWGFVFFTQGGEKLEIPEDEYRKLALWPVFYAQYAHYRHHNKFTQNLGALDIERGDYPINVETTRHTFELTCPSSDGKGTVSLRSDGFTCVMKD